MTQSHKSPHIKVTRKHLLKNIERQIKQLEKSSRDPLTVELVRGIKGSLDAYLSTLPASYKALEND